MMCTVPTEHFEWGQKLFLYQQRTMCHKIKPQKVAAWDMLEIIDLESPEADEESGILLMMMIIVTTTMMMMMKKEDSNIHRKLMMY